MLLDFDNNGIVAVTGLSGPVTNTILIIWAIGGSILFSFLFPRTFCPLFLKSKKKILKRYKDAYIETNPMILSKRKFIIRSIYLFLLTLGLLSFVLPLINPADWLPDGKNAIKYYEGELGVPGQYTMPVMGNIIMLVAPFAVGLWSIGWAMEDAGLMHYKFDDRKGKELYEIEPIHVRYNSYLKGYAGISSIVFLIQVAITWSTIRERSGEMRISDIIGTFLAPLSIILIALPAYIMYAMFVAKSEFLTMDLKELKQLTEQDILKS